MEKGESLRATIKKIPVSMYEVPGHKGIQNRELVRYLKDKKQDKRIQDADSLSYRRQEKFKFLSKDEKFLFLKRYALKKDKTKKEFVLDGLFFVRSGFESMDVEQELELLSLLLSSFGTYRNEEVREQVSSYLSQKERIIAEALQHPNARIQEVAVRLVHRLQIKESVFEGIAIQQIEQAIISGEFDKMLIIKQLMRLINSVDKRNVIVRCLKDPNTKIKLIGASAMSTYLPSKIGELLDMYTTDIEKIITNPDPSAIETAIELSEILPNKQKKEMRDLIRARVNEFMEQGRMEEILSPALYKREIVDETKFERKSLFKSGSDTTLLGGSLKGKAILRHIKPEPFQVWQKLYENNALWEQYGFDYVPIEPIVSYHFSPTTGLVDTFSGVLDINLKSWTAISDLFAKELEVQSAKILLALKRMDVHHNHAHPGNFCLRFFRGADGKPDLSKVPRLYLIDFDKASFE